MPDVVFVPTISCTIQGIELGAQVSQTSVSRFCVCFVIVHLDSQCLAKTTLQLLTN